MYCEYLETAQQSQLFRWYLSDGDVTNDIILRLERIYRLQSVAGSMTT